MSGGYRALTPLEKAHQSEESADRMIAEASQHDSLSDFAQRAKREAKRLRSKASRYRLQARNK